MRHPLLVMLLTFLLSCLTFQPALGQQARQPSPYVNIDFPGGTLAEYVAAVEKAAGDQLNIVTFDETAKKLTVPPIRLRQITPNMAISALGPMDLQHDGETYRLMVDLIQGSAPGGPINMRISTMKMSAASQPPAKPRTMIFAAQPLLDAGMEAEHLLSAVEIALTLTTKNEPADVRFHEETGLIFASGSLDQINAIHELMRTLRDSFEERLNEPVEDLEAELEEAHGEIEQLEMEIEELHGLLEDMEAERAAVEGELRAMKMERQRLDEQAEHRVREFAEQAETRLQMERERAEQQAQIVREQVRAQAEGELTKMELQREDLQRRLEEVMHENEQLKEVRGNAQRMIDDMDRRWTKEREGWEDQRQRFTARIHELEQAIAAERKKNEGG